MEKMSSDLHVKKMEHVGYKMYLKKKNYTSLLSSHPHALQQRQVGLDDDQILACQKISSEWLPNMRRRTLSLSTWLGQKTKFFQCVYLKAPLIIKNDIHWISKYFYFQMMRLHDWCVTKPQDFWLIAIPQKSHKLHLFYCWLFLTLTSHCPMSTIILYYHSKGCV